MTDTKENIMGTLPIGKLLMKMSVPVILSMLVSTLYGVIDSIFVSRLGDNALTAMSLATPISSLIACITVGFSVGMNAELSKKLGEGDPDAANKAAGNGILVNWIVAGVFLIFGLFFVPVFYRLQTDNTAIQQIGTDYTSIICIFSFGVANQVMFERMLVATGRSLGSMFSLLTGTIVNLILDPILIFGYLGAPELGMKGAAIATAAITLFGLLIFQLIPDTLLALFNAQDEVLEIGRVALRIVSFVFPFSGITLILGAFFQALGNSRKTLLTSVVQLAVMLTSAIILSRVGTVNTVWFAFVITEVLVAALAILLMKLVYSRTICNIPQGRSENSATVLAASK